LSIGGDGRPLSIAYQLVCIEAGVQKFLVQNQVFLTPHDMRLFPANVSLVHISGDGRRRKHQRGPYAVATAPPTSIFSVHAARRVAMALSDAFRRFQTLCLQLSAGAVRKKALTIGN